MVEVRGVAGVSGRVAAGGEVVFKGRGVNNKKPRRSGARGIR